MKVKFYALALVLTLAIVIIAACSPEVVEKKVITNVYVDTGSGTDKKDVTCDSVNASFWGLPDILFEGWQPEYHIKASTNNGELEGRTWDSSDKNIFEYSHILFTKSNYSSDLVTSSDITTDNNKKIITANDKILFAEEYKLYKKTPVTPDIIDVSSFNEIKSILSTVDNTMISDFEKAYTLANATYKKTNAVTETRIKEILEAGLFLDKENLEDVVYDSTNDTVTINLNKKIIGDFKLEDGDKIAVIATNRPHQWYPNSTFDYVDYSVVDCLPVAGNVSVVNKNSVTIDTKSGTATDCVNSSV